MSSTEIALWFLGALCCLGAWLPAVVYLCVKLGVRAYHRGSCAARAELSYGDD